MSAFLYNKRVLTFLHKEENVSQQEWLRSVVLDSSSGVLLFAIVALEHEERYGPMIFLDEGLILKGLVYHKFYSGTNDSAVDDPSQVTTGFPESVRAGLHEAFHLQNHVDTHEARFLDAVVRSYEMIWALEKFRTGQHERDFLEIMERHYSTVAEYMEKFIGIRMLVDPSMQEIAVLLTEKSNAPQ